MQHLVPSVSPLHLPMQQAEKFLSIFLSFLQVNKAVRLLRTKRQWVDLGIHTEACMTRPETCDSGGAISLWVRPVGYWSWGGFISSQIDGYSGSVMFSASFGFQ